MPDTTFDIGMTGSGRLASRIADAGYRLCVRDVVPAAIEPLVRWGAQPGDSPLSSYITGETIDVAGDRPRHV